MLKFLKYELCTTSLKNATKRPRINRSCIVLLYPGHSNRVVTLCNVTELGMSVSQILNLTLTQSVKAMISLAEVTLPVLPLAVKDAENRED
jgi:hypothetical protein